MSLRELAEQDLAVVLENGSDFGWPITVTDPDGLSGSLTGSSTDIAQVIDPDTGEAVSGRMAAVTLRISSLTAAGLGLPVAIADSTGLPWRVTFDDINGTPYTFLVAQSNPDRALGVVTCILRIYNGA